MLIVVTNKSTLLTGAQADAMTAAINYQVAHHVAPAWNLVPPVVAFLQDATHVPAGTAVIGIFDDADQAGDLGWHTEAAGGVVYGRVFAQPVLSNGGEITEGALTVASVLSHEVIETVGDSACDLWADAGAGTAYARELCDAVESDTYIVEAANGSPRVSVSDFLLPAWFDPDALPGSHCDYLGLITTPFQVRTTGYTLTMTEGTVNQVFGEEYPEWRKATKTFPIARTARRLRQGNVRHPSVLPGGRRGDVRGIHEGNEPPPRVAAAPVAGGA